MIVPRDEQVKLVCEGLALGTLTLGVVAIREGKVGIVHALEQAWTKWSYSTRFPGLAGELGRNDLYLGFSDSQSRLGLGACAAWRSEDGWTHPFISRVGWTLEYGLAFLGGQNYGVSSDGWLDLARSFTDAFEPDSIRRTD